MIEEEQQRQYDEAVAALQAQLPDIKKARTAKVKMSNGSEYSYKYANLSTISARVLPLLAKHGLSWVTKPQLNANDKFVLYYRLRHVAGGQDDGEFPITSSGTMQSIGSAITYARRYALCSVTGLAPEDDDDDAARAETAETQQDKVRGRSAQRRNTQAATQQPADGPALITKAQQDRMVKAFVALKTNDKARRLAIASKVTGRTLTTSTEMTEIEAKALLDTLAPMVKAGDDGALLLADLMREDTEPAPEPPAGDAT